MVGAWMRRRSTVRLLVSAALLATLAGATVFARPSHAAPCYGTPDTGWTPHCSYGETPPARFGAAMAELPSAGMIVLFGGCGSTRTDPTRASFADGSTAVADFSWCPAARDGEQNAFDDTWVWESDRWRKVARPPGAPWPHARWGASMAYDRTAGAVVLFGGLYQTASASGLPDAEAASCWGSKVVQLTNLSTGVIEYRDTPITSVTVPAGSGGTSVPLSSTCFRDTWLFDGSSWRRASPAVAPSARFEHAMSGGRACVQGPDASAGSCAPTSGLATLFSGCEAIGMVGSHGRPDRPTYFDCSRVAGRETTYTVTAPNGEERERKATIGDTWVWRDGSWTRVCPASGGCRPARTSTGCTTPRAEVHGISLCAPSARRGATMSYNPATGSTLLFGGHAYDPVWDYRGHKADTWQWDAGSTCLDGNDGPRLGPCWRLVMADWKAYHWSAPLPGPRAWSASTAAGVGGQWRVMMFGGNGYARFDASNPTAEQSRYAEPLNDTWVWLDGAAGGCTDGSDLYDTTCWQPCATCVGSAPSRRAAANLAYHAGGGRVLLFGGTCDGYCGSDGNADQYADTWTLQAPPPVI